MAASLEENRIDDELLAVSDGAPAATVESRR
jgi:hypothetical protein